MNILFHEPPLYKNHHSNNFVYLTHRKFELSNMNEKDKTLLQENKEWLSSKEAQKAMKIQSCELMHLRVAGKLTFKKKGNAYFYLKKDCKK